MDTQKIPWRKLREKVYIKNLARDEKRNFQFDILKLDPNITHPEHEHQDVEWIYVLKGSFRDEFGNYKAGYFKINPKLSEHTISTGKDGCELLICWCGKLKGE